MHMTVARLAIFALGADRPTATEADHGALALATAQRKAERGPSKLARRLTRKAALGLAGAF